MMSHSKGNFVGSDKAISTCQESSQQRQSGREMSDKHGCGLVLFLLLVLVAYSTVTEQRGSSR